MQLMNLRPRVKHELCRDNKFHDILFEGINASTSSSTTTQLWTPSLQKVKVTARPFHTLVLQVFCHSLSDVYLFIRCSCGCGGGVMVLYTKWRLQVLQTIPSNTAANIP